MRFKNFQLWFWIGLLLLLVLSAFPSYILRPFINCKMFKTLTYFCWIDPLSLLNKNPPSFLVILVDCWEKTFAYYVYDKHIRIYSEQIKNFQNPKIYKLSKKDKKFEYAVDPWTTRVWTAWVHLYKDFFFSLNTYHSTTLSTTGWICRCRTEDMEGWLQSYIWIFDCAGDGCP